MSARVIVTGAAGGIGAATVENLRARGARVVGAVGYALIRAVPRKLVDRVTSQRMRRLARDGHFAADGLAGDYAARARSA